jgi:aspartyl protease family protein
MLKHSILFGIFIGATFGAPMVYMRNSDSLQQWIQSGKQQPVALNVEPQQKITPALSLSGTTAAIPIDQSGHFKADFKMNGRKLNGLIDTGATFVAINRTTASRIGIKVSSQDMKYKVATANGKAQAAGVIIKEISIGKIRINNVEALVLEDKALDGILIGMSFLKQLNRFSVENQTMILKQ